MRQRRRDMEGNAGNGGVPGEARGGGMAAAVVDGAEATTDDVERYLVHLAHLDMPLPMKIELIRTVGDIMQSFVDRAFGNDPTQLALRAHQQENKSSAKPDLGMIDLSIPQIETNELSDSFHAKPGGEKRERTKHDSK